MFLDIQSIFSGRPEQVFGHLKRIRGRPKQFSIDLLWKYLLALTLDPDLRHGAERLLTKVIQQNLGSSL